MILSLFLKLINYLLIHFYYNINHVSYVKYDIVKIIKIVKYFDSVVYFIFVSRKWEMLKRCMLSSEKFALKTVAFVNYTSKGVIEYFYCPLFLFHCELSILLFRYRSSFQGLYRNG